MNTKQYFTWTEKYKPADSDSIVGNSTQIELIRNWIHNFKHRALSVQNAQSQPNSEWADCKNGLVISGDTGVGKTLAATLLLKEGGYDVIEYNAGDLRKIKNIKTKLTSIVSGSNIMMMVKKHQTTAIIIDEIDTMTRGEKGSVRQIKQFIKNQKTFARQARLKTRTKTKSTASNDATNAAVNINPVICICNSINSSVKQLLQDTIHIHFSKPSPQTLHNFVQSICVKENIRFSDECFDIVVKHAQQDIRRTLYILQNVKAYFHDRVVTKKDMKSVITSFTKKDLNLSLFESVHHLIQQPVRTVDELLNLYSVDKHLVPLYIHENSYMNLAKNCKGSDQDKLLKMDWFYSNLIESNIIEKNIRHNHNWVLDDYVGVLSCYPMNIALTGDCQTKEIKYTKINNSPVFSKINYKFFNLKLMNNIARKLNMSIDNFHDFTEIIYDLFIFQQPDAAQYDKFVTFLKQTNFTFKDVDKSIKLSYLFETHSKKYTRKKKITAKIV